MLPRFITVFCGTPNISAAAWPLSSTWRYLLFNLADLRNGVTEIPVVPHVVYSDAAGKIDHALQIQIDALSRDYRKRNAHANQTACGPAWSPTPVPSSRWPQPILEAKPLGSHAAPDKLLVKRLALTVALALFRTTGIVRLLLSGH